MSVQEIKLSIRNKHTAVLVVVVAVGCKRRQRSTRCTSSQLEFPAASPVEIRVSNRACSANSTTGRRWHGGSGRRDSGFLQYENNISVLRDTGFLCLLTVVVAVVVGAEPLRRL